MIAPGVLVVLTSICASLLLGIVCWRMRAAMALVCAAGGCAFALAALWTHAPSLTLVGSLLSSAIGVALLALGQFVESLLDAEPSGAPQLPR